MGPPAARGKTVSPSVCVKFKYSWVALDGVHGAVAVRRDDRAETSRRRGESRTAHEVVFNPRILCFSFVWAKQRPTLFETPACYE